MIKPFRYCKIQGTKKLKIGNLPYENLGLIFRARRSQLFFYIGVLKNFALLEPFLIKLWAHFYRASTVAASGFLRQQIPFSVKSGMHWRRSHWLLSRTPLKTLVKPQKQLLYLFYKKGVLRNFVNFIGKHLYRSLFLTELQTKRLKHRCFPVAFVKFLETGVYERLLLKPVVSPGVSSN